MAVDIDKPDIEKHISAVNDWIRNISETGEVSPDITPQVLKEVLVHFGADMEPKEDLKALGSYSNLKKRPGMDAVWGKERVDNMRSWVDAYITQYEDRSGRPLPALEDSTIKHAGMMQFFGELTAYAAGQLDFGNYKRLTEDRVRKGKLWQERDLDAPYTKSKHASFPPEFPVDAWTYLKQPAS